MLFGLQYSIYTSDSVMDTHTKKNSSLETTSCCCKQYANGKTGPYTHCARSCPYMHVIFTSPNTNNSQIHICELSVCNYCSMTVLNFWAAAHKVNTTLSWYVMVWSLGVEEMKSLMWALISCSKCLWTFIRDRCVSLFCVFNLHMLENEHSADTQFFCLRKLQIKAACVWHPHVLRSWQRVFMCKIDI